MTETNQRSQPGCETPTAVQKSLDILKWMREPDYAENFSLEDLSIWLNRRPVAEMCNVVDALSALPDATGGREATSVAQAPLQEALEQIRAVCADNDSDDCGHHLALRFVGNVAARVLSPVSSTEHRCRNCGDPHTEVKEVFCGMCREMGCTMSPADGGPAT